MSCERHRRRWHSVGLAHRARTRSDRLSGGERQKLAIARMLMQRPTLILADEATASLDPQAAAEVCQLLAQAATGATLVSVVHNPALIPLLAHRVVGLKLGQVVFDLPVDQLTEARLDALYAGHCAGPGPADDLTLSAASPSDRASPQRAFSATPCHDA